MSCLSAGMQILIQDASSDNLLTSRPGRDSCCLCSTKFVSKDNKRTEKKTLTESEDYLEISNQQICRELSD